MAVLRTFGRGANPAGGAPRARLVAEADRRIEKDPATGTPIAVWVRWKGRPHLYESEAADRHYTLERVRGLLAFGDGRYGRIPPAGCPVRASYTTGVGLAGNVPAGTITELRTGAAYLGSVNNPFPAVGGGDTEPLAAVGQRGPQRVRHRDRAVAAADYEWLAREASPAVARARCLALLAPQGRKVRGATSLVIVPRSTERFPQPDAGLLRRVREHLQPRMPACAASALQLFGPAYVAGTVHAHVVPLRAGDAATVGAALRRGIDAYLHPLSGGAEGNGWDFGQPVNLSAIALLVETTPGVDYAIEISLHAGDERVGDRVEVPPDALVAAGRHQLKISVGIE